MKKVENDHCKKQWKWGEKERKFTFMFNTVHQTLETEMLGTMSNIKR